MDFKHSSSEPKPKKTIKHFLVPCSFILVVIWIYLGTWYYRGPADTVAPVQKAVVFLSGSSNVTGNVTFFQPHGSGPVTVIGNIQNLDPESLRGFHVHETGDLSNGCLSTGPHFNPFHRSHGAPTDKNRHVGDLGNIASDRDGSAVFSKQDSQLTLNGPLSILGRAVVIHAGTDDLGKGGNEESLKTGNAGARAACGVISVVA